VARRSFARAMVERLARGVKMFAKGGKAKGGKAEGGGAKGGDVESGEVESGEATSRLRVAGEHIVKAELVRKIAALMKEQGLKQIEAAGVLGVKQPDISKMLRGDFRQFSVERLLRFLVALGQDVEIVVKPRSSGDAVPMLRVG
jgi:predicted XRE-type DNA-binding protein